MIYLKGQFAKPAKLSKEEFMQYEKSLMAKWDAYAILKTAKEEGREEGINQNKREVVKNLLNGGELTITQIANYVNVTEAFVLSVKNEKL